MTGKTYTFDVPILGDEEPEEMEDFWLNATVKEKNNLEEVSIPVGGLGTIIDDDSPKDLQIVIKGDRAKEGENLHFWFELQDSNGNLVTLKEDLTFNVEAIEGTATRDDYSLLGTSSITIAAGSSEGLLEVLAIDDNHSKVDGDKEGNEHFFIGISSNPMDGYETYLSDLELVA